MSPRLTFYLDTSGEPLFKRGHRVVSVEAPLRENLAAGLLRLAGWTPERRPARPHVRQRNDPARSHDVGAPHRARAVSVIRV